MSTDPRTNLYLVICTLAIVIYSGLAFHVISRNPRRTISWVFGGFCFGIASYYLSSIFLFPDAYPQDFVTPFALRWKWVVSSIAPALFMHLASFYFPSSWKPFSKIWLIISYCLGIVLALSALFSNLLVAGPEFRPPPHTISIDPGPLFFILLAFLTLNVIIGIAGIYQEYRTTSFLTLRRQILYLLTPFYVFLFVWFLFIIIIITQNPSSIPHEIGDILLILAGISFAKAVADYGSFVGRPMAQRELFYSIISVIAILVLSGFTMAADQYLAVYTPYPYPVITGLFVILLVIVAPVGYPWVTHRLDRLLTLQEEQQDTLVLDHLEQLSTASDPEKIQTELLGIICRALRVKGGYVALPNPDSSLEMLVVRVTHRETRVQVGDNIRIPKLNSIEPRLIDALAPQDQTMIRQQQVALVCTLKATQETDGLLALGEKRDGTAFSSRELALCNTLVKQVETTIQMMQLNQDRETHIKALQAQEHTLEKMEQAVIDATSRALDERGTIKDVLNIFLLGPFQVARGDKRIPEADWGSERAKTMLVYLLWKGAAGATRDEICRVLWPERTKEEAINVFYVTTHRLRSALEPELKEMRKSQYIHNKRGRYYFNSTSHYWLDIEAFEKAVTRDDTEGLKEAISLYRGAYLEDEVWNLPTDVEIQRRAFELKYINALEQLSSCMEDQEAEPYLARLLGVEPTNETARKRLTNLFQKQERPDLIEKLIR